MSVIDTVYDRLTWAIAHYPGIRYTHNRCMKMVVFVESRSCPLTVKQPISLEIFTTMAYIDTHY